MDAIRIDVIDNCFLWPMTNLEVADAFADRVLDIQNRTQEYRVENGDNTQLPITWPLSSFDNPTDPKSIFIAIDRTKADDESFLGFVEAETIPRDYAKVAACVVLAPWISANGMRAIDITKKLFDEFVAECVAMDIATITVPRNWSDYTANDKYTSARYNFSTNDIRERRAHVSAICSALCPHYPYLYFKTPFKTQYIVVDSSSAAFLDRFIELFLNGPRTRDLDVYRTYHVSLWRALDDQKKPQFLNPMETDIVVAWQRKQFVHQALELEHETKRPLRIFGKELILVPEHPDRLTVVGARRRIDIPPEAIKIENHLWQDALMSERRVETKTSFESRTNMQDRVAKARRATLSNQEEGQIELLRQNMRQEHKNQASQQPRQERRRVRGQNRAAPEIVQSIQQMMSQIQQTRRGQRNRNGQNRPSVAEESAQPQFENLLFGPEENVRSRPQTSEEAARQAALEVFEQESRRNVERESDESIVSLIPSSPIPNVRQNMRQEHKNQASQQPRQERRRVRGQNRAAPEIVQSIQQMMSQIQQTRREQRNGNGQNRPSVAEESTQPQFENLLFGPEENVRSRPQTSEEAARQAALEVFEQESRRNVERESDEPMVSLIPSSPIPNLADFDFESLPNWEDLDVPLGL